MNVALDNCGIWMSEPHNSDTLSACIMREPEHMEEFARQYALLFRKLHDIHMPQAGHLPDARERDEKAVRHLSRFFDTPSVDLLLQIVYAIPSGDCLLHCNLHAKNIVVHNSELSLADKAEMGYGHPLLDLGHAYSAMVTLVGDYDTIIGMPREYGKQLWQHFMRYYFEEDADVLAHREEQMEAVACVRDFTRLTLSDSIPESVIWEFQHAFAERVTQRKEYLLRVCSTFNDWNI